MRHLKLALSLIVMLAAFGVAGQARAETPTEFLQDKDKKLKPLLGNVDANEAKILKHINQMLDFDTLCKNSLGKHWDERTDEERKKFVKTLKELIETNVKKRLADTKDHIVTYESETLSKDKKSATVITIVADGKGPRAMQTEIAYKMEKRKGTWFVVDMVTDGVSLVQNYRSQFNKIISKDGWDKLIEKMEAKLAEA